MPDPGITIEQTASGSVTAQTSVSAVLGSAPEEGKVLLAYWGANNCGVSNFPLPSGWVQLASREVTTTTGALALFRKVAGASESATQTFTATASCNARLTVFVLGGVNTSDIWAETTTNRVTGVASLTTTGLNTEERNAYEFVGFQSDNASPGFLNTWTNSFVRQSIVGNSHTTAAYAAADIGNYATTETWTTTAGMVSVSVTLHVSNPLRITVGTSYVNAATGTSVAINGGDGAGTLVAAGDLRVVFFGARNGTYAELNTPAGWTGIHSVGDTSPGMRAIHRISAGGTEKDGLTLTSTTSRDLIGIETIVTNVNEESPIGASTSDSSVTTQTSLATTAVESLEGAAIAMVGVVGAGTGDFTGVSWTNGFVSRGGGGTSGKMDNATKDLMDPGPYSTTRTWVTAMSARSIAFVIKQEPTPLVAGDGWGISS